MKVITKIHIIIPAGTELRQAPRKTERFIPHYDHVIGFGPDGTGDFTVDEETVKLNPDTFEVVQ